MIKFFKELYDEIFDTPAHEQRLKDRQREETLAHLAKQKLLADTKDEPWVAVVDVDLSSIGKGVSTGSMELDWNRRFVESLIDAGYSGRTEHELVDQWFRDVCRGVLSEAGDNIDQ